MVDGAAAAGVITIALPHMLTPALPAAQLGRALLQLGFHIAFESSYLRERNWVQLAWMGQLEEALLLAAIAAMRTETVNLTPQSHVKRSL